MWREDERKVLNPRIPGDRILVFMLIIKASLMTVPNCVDMAIL